ncbi:MAG: adenylate/guanylate cyclase domain-containing protein, partial [Leptospiraceae bacterium]|nr:adenylate/guanylate cyclase domain-containing protein [Leptospiraceae bacterium]
TIWVESSDYSFYIQVQPDDIRLIHNESELADAFTIGADLRIEFDRVSNTLSVNSQPIARFNSTAPTAFALLDGSGVILGKNRREYVWEPENDSVYFDLSFSAKGDPASDPGSGYVENEADLRWLRKKFNNNNAAVDPEVSRGTYGDYISAYGVIHNDRDEPVGLICLDISAGSILAFRATLVWLSASIFLLAILLALLLSILLTRYITRPLRMFTLAIQDYRNGQLTTQVKWESADEFGDLAHSMNTMASSLHDAHGRIVSINEAFRRFVPGDFLRFLNRNDVTQIRLGDQIQKQMTVLFSDIRSFTTISEKMSPRENFAFINDYLSHIGPAVRNWNGFIDKYIGDAIMALFPDTPENAIIAALDMQRRLIDFNRTRGAGDAPVRMGIGVHTGDLMLGVVGEKMRMDGTVISDAVNIAARLESLTKTYRCQILASGAVLAAVTRPDRIGSRYLGALQVKGKEHSVDVYEIFDADEPHMADSKQATKTQFELAVQSMQTGKVDAARSIFMQILDAHPDDSTARALMDMLNKDSTHVNPVDY